VRSSTVRWSLLAVLVVASLGCATAQKPPAQAGQGGAPSVTSPAAPGAPRAPDAAVTGLRFNVDPPDAQISIDGAPRGAVGELADRQGLLPLAPGIYQVSLKAPGFVTWRAEVALGATVETLKVSLVKKP
jgi:hypothetical protein